MFKKTVGNLSVRINTPFCSFHPSNLYRAARQLRRVENALRRTKQYWRLWLRAPRGGKEFSEPSGSTINILLV